MHLPAKTFRMVKKCIPQAGIGRYATSYGNLLNAQIFCRPDAQLKEKAGFSANIITRLKRNEYVSIESIEKICRVMECGVDDILEFVSEEK